ncbi:MAG: FAD-dependent oxidoreductase [Roseburia sp. 40_7]|nr:MAG: FAD-dependent oxidoreductase [Roseburia sp. 40_7]
MSKVIIIGGGAAGMFAALGAVDAGHQVTILEQNEKLGKKIYITGKGRCNLTNACETSEIFENIPRNAKFLYSAIYGYDNFRVFPVSDHSSDVIATLQRTLKNKGVTVRLHTKAEHLEIEEGKVRGVKTSNGTTCPADAVIIATGGYSYQTTGSTGDGYRFAKKSGHTIAPLSPSLVPMTVKEDYCMQMQGLSLKNVEVKIKDGKKVLFEEFGEMLFTHFGVSGPLILSASSVVNDKIRKKELAMEIDLKPALSEEKLDARILRDFEENKNRQFKNVLSGLLPAKMISVMVSLSGITPEKKINEITKEERRRLVNCIKHFPMTLTGLRDYNEAIITRGGVAVKNIDPSTMQSKLVKGLYFAGEVIDVDAYTGGFNLQIAWSTGYLAGSSVEK